MILDSAAAKQSIVAVQNALRILMALHLTAFEYPEQSCVFDGRSYDYIIVGGGTAGCVLANRLVEDNKTTVLLIEAGDDPPLESHIPFLMLFLKSSAESWNYTIVDPGLSQQSHNPAKDDLTLGKVLGGSSSLSYNLYSTGSKHDYDDWAKIVNDTIWNWNNVLPFLKKSQRLNDPRLLSTDSEFFGQDGNIGLTVIRNTGTIRSDPYLKIFSEMGNEIVNSLNGNTSLGYTNGIFTISNNVKQSSAYSYLAPLKNNPNLHILKNTIVKRIVFDKNKNAVGVEAYTCNKRHIFVRARIEVILSTGVVNTPKLLMLSGIGPREQLRKHNIHTLSDLPVGEDFQDHLSVCLFFNMTKLVVPFRPFPPKEFTATAIIGYANLNKSNDYPDYQSLNLVTFTKYVMSFCSFYYNYNEAICNNISKTNVNSQMIFTVINKQRFKSRGRVILKSNHFKDDPLIYTGYFSVEEDIEDFARIIQDYMRMTDTATFKKLGGEFKDPKLSQCGEYNKYNLEYWKCYVQFMTSSLYQYSSTCPMGTVVDSRLKVYGVKRLRVVDASVMPYPTAGGTLGPTIMIGEKAADMIKEDKNAEVL